MRSSRVPNHPPKDGVTNDLETAQLPIRTIKIGIDELPNDRGRRNYARLEELVAEHGIVTRGCQEPWSVPISLLRFTHDEANDRFGDGRSVWEFINRVREHIEFLMEVPPLRVVQIGDLLYSLDNRRLAGANMAELSLVLVRWATPEEIKAELVWRFSSTDQGESVTMPNGDRITVRKIA